MGNLVDAVEIGAFLAIDLDVDELGVHPRRDVGVFERFVCHHVTPVAGRVADREQDGLVLARRALERFAAPGIPVDRVVGVLQEIGAGSVGELVQVRVVSATSHTLKAERL